MKTPYFKKTTDSVGNEWVDSQDIFQYTDELGPFFNKRSTCGCYNNSVVRIS